MSTDARHEEIESLLGAFVLDAAEPDELAMVEAHLSGCPRCRAEVDGLREVAGALGNAAVPLPPHLWDRISEKLGDRPPTDIPLPSMMRSEPTYGAAATTAATAPIVGPATTPTPTPAEIDELAARRAAQAAHSADRRHLSDKTRSLRWTSAVLGVAASVAIAVLAVGLANADGRLNQNQQKGHGSTQTVSAVQAALDTPGHSVVDLRTGEGVVAAKMVLTPNGRGYMYDAHMAALPADETYQLWGLIDQQPISLALLGSDPSQAAFTVASTTPTQLMVTVEPAGGVPTPDKGAVASGKVVAA